MMHYVDYTIENKTRADARVVHVAIVTVLVQDSSHKIAQGVAYPNSNIDQKSASSLIHEHPVWKR